MNIQDPTQLQLVNGCINALIANGCADTPDSMRIANGILDNHKDDTYEDSNGVSHKRNKVPRKTWASRFATTASIPLRTAATSSIPKMFASLKPFPLIKRTRHRA